MAFPIQLPPAQTIITAMMVLLNHLSTLENFIAAVDRCLKLVLKVLLIVTLPLAVVYPSLRVYEHINKLELFETPSDGGNFYYYFLAVLGIIFSGLAYWRAAHKNEKVPFTATNLLKLIGVRVFIIVIMSHLWAEFVLKKVEEKIGWTTFTSLFYSVIVIDVGLDRYALDTGFPEAAVMLCVRFIVNFHK